MPVGAASDDQSIRFIHGHAGAGCGGGLFGKYFSIMGPESKNTIIAC